MTTVEQERLSFYIDLSEPEQVYQFPKSFMRFLIKNNRAEEAEEFINAVNYYLQTTDDDEATLSTILNIGDYYASIEDCSGVPFHQNDLFRHQGTEMSAEEVLESMEHESDEPNVIKPAHPDVVVVVFADGNIADVVYDSVSGLRYAGYKNSAHQMAREARRLVQSRPTIVEIIRFLSTYVTLISESTEYERAAG